MKANYYKWGEYINETDFDIEFPLNEDNLIQLTSDHLEGFTIIKEDKDKVFYAYLEDIEDSEDEGFGVKNAWAIEKVI